jgi:hypothetical protein
MTTFPAHETAALIREYAQWALDECWNSPEHLLLAIIDTDATTAGACCHMGRAMIEIEQGLEDHVYRLGGEMCDPRMTEIARRLGMVS